jgi:RNAse (barnase) inhibitor barstar
VKRIIINGSNISDAETFFNEIDNVLTKDLDWETGHNLNAFNDLLMGGFGVTDYEESFILIWKDYCKTTLEKELLNMIIEIIKEHTHIQLELK